MSRQINYDPRAQEQRERNARLNRLRASMIATQPRTSFLPVIVATFTIAFCVCLVAFQFV